jgi:hypothetical protein
MATVLTVVRPPRTPPRAPRRLESADRHADNPSGLAPPHPAESTAVADPTLPIPPPPPPHPDSDRLARGVRRCLPLATRLDGVLYRAASVRRANPADLIAGIGSQLTGGRWTPPGAFPAVYASRDEVTALDEAPSTIADSASRPGWPCPWS